MSRVYKTGISRKRSLPILLLTIIPLHAENWPQFRGPTGLGYASDSNLSPSWEGARGENIVWKSQLHGEDAPFRPFLKYARLSLADPRARVPLPEWTRASRTLQRGGARGGGCPFTGKENRKCCDLRGLD